MISYSVFNIELSKTQGQWKRLSKKKNAQGQEERVFENKCSKIKVLTVDDEIKGLLAEGKYVFHIEFKEKTTWDSEWVSISDLNYFLQQKACSDWHLSNLVVLPDCLSEEMEGVFSSTKDEATTRAELLALGFVEREDYSKFLNDCITKQS